MPGRKYYNGSEYRYGFNGKENDKDAGEGIQDYGMRVYDTRLGKFLSVDPITKEYPELTPYQFASNCVIAGIDLDGLEIYYTFDGKLIGKNGKSTEIRIVKKEDTYAVGHVLQIINGKPPDKRGKELQQSYKKSGPYVLNKLSMESYGNLDDAAADFSLMNGSISIVDNKELATRIGSVKLEGTNKTVFILGKTVEGYSDNADINSSDLYGTTLAGGAHIHGRAPRERGQKNGLDNFSGSAIDAKISLGLQGDMDWANRNGVPLYLSNPAGVLKVYTPQKYEPGVELGKTIRCDMPFDIFASSGDKENNRPAYDYKLIQYQLNREPRSDEAIPYKLPPKKP